MSEPWTPGPWTVRGVWSDGFGYRNRNEPPDVWTVDPVMFEGGYDGLWQGGVETEADARLIAAAPEMAEWVAMVAASAGLTISQHNAELCRALLSRIRGEAEVSA